VGAEFFHMKGRTDMTKLIVPVGDFLIDSVAVAAVGQADILFKRKKEYKKYLHTCILL
jgi:uncharacterized protein YcaQ